MAFLRAKLSRPHVGVIGVTAVAAIVLLTRLSTLSLWGDEGFAIQEVKLPWGAIFSDLAQIDYNMSLYYIVLKAWTSIWGTSEAAARSLSSIFVLAALPLFYRLAVRIAGRRIALGSVVLLGLNPFFLELGLTARPFAMALLWGVVATLVLVRTLEEGNRRWWLAYGLLASIGLHIQLTSLLVIAAHGIFALLYQRRVNRFNLEAIGVITFTGLLPSIIFLAPPDTLAWIGPFALGTAARVALAVAGGALLAVVLLPLATYGLFRPPAPRHALTWLPATWLTVPIALMLIIAPIQSLFVDWYFAVLVPVIALLAAMGLDRILASREKPLVALAAVLSTAALAVTLGTTGIGERQGWREVSAMMSGRVEPSDAVAFPNAFYRIVAEYYAPSSATGPYSAGNPILPNEAWGTMTPFELDQVKRTGTQADHDVFEPEILAWDRIWLVGIGDELYLAVSSDLESHGYQEQDDVDYNGVEAHLYVRG